MTAPDPHLTYLRQTAEQLGCSDIAAYVLFDPRFAVWSASAREGHHHYGTGGLVRHTAEVVRLCLANRALLGMWPAFGLASKLPSEQAVYLAALAHDAAKIYDYEHVGRLYATFPQPGDGWGPAPHKRLIHHVSRSAIEWSKAIDRFPAYAPMHDEVLHAILSHHGRPEWGSPIQPKSRLAWLLHTCDMLSARMDDADTVDVAAI